MLLLIGIGVFCGVATLFTIDDLNAVFCTTVLVIIVWALLLACYCHHRFNTALGKGIAIISVAYLAGALLAYQHISLYLENRLNVALEGRDIIIQGRISTIPEAIVGGVRFEMRVEHTEPTSTLHRVRLNWYQPQKQPGVDEVWRFRVRLKRPHGFFNPVGFDYEQWLLVNKIDATGYVRGQHAAQIKPAPCCRINVLRQELWHSIRDTGADSAGLVAALVLGERHGLQSEEKARFSNTGTAHLFAISGLHIGMIASLAYFFIRWILLGSIIVFWQKHTAIWTRLRLDRIALLGSFAIALGYGTLAGLSLPTQRALAMLAVGYGAALLQRPVLSTHSFATALLLVLILQPQSILGPGFWLSFGAVVWIVFLWQCLPPNWQKWRKIIVLQILLPIALAPMIHFWFGESAASSALANIILIPLVGTVVLPLALLLCFGMLVVPDVATALFPLIDLIYTLIKNLLDGFAALPAAKFYFAHFGILQTGASMLAMALLILPRPMPFVGLGTVLIVAIALPRQDRPATGEFRVDVMDVGQGLSVLIQTRHHNLLYDTGPVFRSGFNTAKAVVLPYLRSQGISKLDKLIFSHADNDHIGGAAELLSSIKADQVLSGEPLRLRTKTGIASDLCQRGYTWHWDGVVFKLLWPTLAASALKSNNRTCVLEIRGAFNSAMVPGDIEHKVEQQLLASNDLKPVTLLLAPHHGSRSSSSPQFITHIRPSYVVFPAGYRNRYNFPHSQVVARYHQLGAVPIEMASCGHLRYSRNQIQCYRKNKVQWWRKQ